MKSLCRVPSSIRAPVSSTFIGRGPKPDRLLFAATSQARHPQHLSRSITMNTGVHRFTSPHRSSLTDVPFLTGRGSPHRHGADPLANRSQEVTG